MSEELESVIKTPKIQRNPGPDGFTGEYYQTFREELMPNALKLFQKMKRIFPNSFYEASIVLTPKPDKDTKRRSQTNTPDEYRCKNSL